MPDVENLSAAKRALLEKYLRGEVAQAATAPRVNSSAPETLAQVEVEKNTPEVVRSGVVAGEHSSSGTNHSVMVSVKAEPLAATSINTENTPTNTKNTPEGKPAMVGSEKEILNRAPVVPLQPKGTRRPLFYFHVHWQGGAFYCFNMARILGEDQPFYVFEPYKI